VAYKGANHGTSSRICLGQNQAGSAVSLRPAVAGLRFGEDGWQMADGGQV
jgi:hypothetical protein